MKEYGSTIQKTNGMKKFHILLMALFLVNEVLGQDSNPALQINYSTHIKRAAYNLQLPTQNSEENVQNAIQFTKCEPPEIYTELTSQNIIKHHPYQQHSLIQIYDSLYYWRWDTITIGWKISSKAIDMVYDGNNNLISNITQQFNSISWVNSYKYTNIYDASNNLINETGYLWTGTDWMNSNQNIYTYDGNNNQTSFISKQWNIGWVNILKFIYTYDANNNQISYLRQNWNGSAWENTSLITYNYDGYNNWTSYLKQKWNGIAWENSWQFTFTYDVNNNLTIELQKKWTNNEWNNFAKYSHTYDANNNDISGLAQIWDGTTWVNSSLLIQIYNANNDWTSRLWQGWNGNTWENYHQETYTYDANGNNTSLTGQDWNGNAWLNSNQELYTYDANNFRSNYSHKNWNNAGFAIIVGDSAHYYFHTASGTNELITQGRAITVFLNPSTEKITISNTTRGSLSILDLNGHQFLQQEITEPNAIIDVSGLKSGVYFVRVTSERTVQVGKFVKQ